MKFEYKILTVSVAHFSQKGFQTELSTKFNDWGAEGWELIKMEPITEGGAVFQGATTSDFVIVFKRQIA